MKLTKPDATKAETYFERALTVARQQRAKSWELRAAVGGTLKSCFGPWSESLRGEDRQTVPLTLKWSRWVFVRAAQPTLSLRAYIDSPSQRQRDS